MFDSGAGVVRVVSRRVTVVAAALVLAAGACGGDGPETPALGVEEQPSAEPAGPVTVNGVSYAAAVTGARRVSDTQVQLDVDVELTNTTGAVVSELRAPSVGCVDDERSGVDVRLDERPSELAAAESRRLSGTANVSSMLDCEAVLFVHLVGGEVADATSAGAIVVDHGPDWGGRVVLGDASAAIDGAEPWPADGFSVAALCDDAAVAAGEEFLAEPVEPQIDEVGTCRWESTPDPASEWGSVGFDAVTWSLDGAEQSTVGSRVVWFEQGTYASALSFDVDGMDAPLQVRLAWAPEPLGDGEFVERAATFDELVALAQAVGLLD